MSFKSEKDTDLVKILTLIAAITEDSPCPKNCPGYLNKPLDEGCGMEVCLSHIEKLTKDQLILSKQDT
jgi:hypothetical protein